MCGIHAGRHNTMNTGEGDQQTNDVVCSVFNMG